MKTNEREYRDFVMEIRSAEDGGDDEKIVRGYASTFNEPYVLYDDGEYELREQVDPKAFEEADMSDVIFQYNHEGRVFARVSNDTLKVSVDDKGLAIEADLGGTDIGRGLYEEIRGGYTTKMSYGYTVDEEKREVTEDKANNKTVVLRTVTKIRKVYDVSAVSIPANDGTSISVRSYSDGVIEELMQERQKALELERQKLITRIKVGGLK